MSAVEIEEITLPGQTKITVELVTDDEGKRKAVIDWQQWEEIVALLQGQAGFYFEPKTALGRELWAIRAKIRASGMPTLSEAEIEQEIADRRGGQQ